MDEPSSHTEHRVPITALRSHCQLAVLRTGGGAATTSSPYPCGAPC